MLWTRPIGACWATCLRSSGTTHTTAPGSSCATPPPSSASPAGRRRSASRACWSWWVWRTRRARKCVSSPAGCSSGLASPRPWLTTLSFSYWTSPPPDWTPGSGSGSGTSFTPWLRNGPWSFLPTSSPTLRPSPDRSSCSGTTGSTAATAPPPSAPGSRARCSRSRRGRRWSRDSSCSASGRGSRGPSCACCATPRLRTVSLCRRGWRTRSWPSTGRARHDASGIRVAQAGPDAGIVGRSGTVRHFQLHANAGDCTLYRPVQRSRWSGLPTGTAGGRGFPDGSAAEGADLLSGRPAGGCGGDGERFRDAGYPGVVGVLRKIYGQLPPGPKPYGLEIRHGGGAGRSSGPDRRGHGPVRRTCDHPGPSVPLRQSSAEGPDGECGSGNAVHTVPAGIRGHPAHHPRRLRHPDRA